MTEASPVIAAMQAQLEEYRQKGLMTLTEARTVLAMSPKCSIDVDIERCVDRFMAMYVNYLAYQQRQTWARSR